MKHASNDEQFTGNIPHGLRCLWMNAGILSYQLCDKEFECERCPLDAAMRMSSSTAHTGEMQQYETVMNTQSEDTPVYRYSQHHCWVKELPNGNVRIGLEPRIASLLFSMKSVVLPTPENHVNEKQCCAWVVLDGGTFPVRAPVNGTVTAINSLLFETPSIVHKHPLDEGWLFEVKPEPAVAGQYRLMQYAGAEKIYNEHFMRFNNLVNIALKGNSISVGATMNDGGQIFQDVSSLLGPHRYVGFLCEAFD